MKDFGNLPIWNLFYIIFEMIRFIKNINRYNKNIPSPTKKNIKHDIVSDDDEYSTHSTHTAFRRTRRHLSRNFVCSDS